MQVLWIELRRNKEFIEDFGGKTLEKQLLGRKRNRLE